MSLISGIVGGVMAADAQKDANRTNRKNVVETNQQNWDAFLLSRGYSQDKWLNGYSQLPFYAKNRGRPVEQRLLGSTNRVYDESVANTIGRGEYEAALAPTMEAQAGAERTVNELFGPEMEANLLMQQQPVSQARVTGAKATGNSALEALADTINQIKAMNAQKGFSNDGMSTRLLDFNAKRQAYQEQSKALSDANLANAQDVQRIQSAVVNGRIQNVGLPLQMGRQSVETMNLADNASLEQQARRQQLYNWFKIGTDKFSRPNMPQVDAVPSALQLTAQATSNFGKQVGQAYLAGQMGGGAGAGGGGAA
jgi:hypothetical protein